MISIIIAILIYLFAPLLGLAIGLKIKKRRVLLILSIAISLVALIVLFPVLFTDLDYVNKYILMFGKFTGFLSLALLLSLFIQQRRLRKIVIYSYAGILFFLNLYSGTAKIFGAVVGLESETIATWIIDEYKISYRENINLTGPPLRQYYLEEFRMNGLLYRLVSVTVDHDNDCIIRFSGLNGNGTFIFNKCDNKLEIK